MQTYSAAFWYCERKWKKDEDKLPSKFQDVLFDQLLYLAYLKNAAIVGIVKNGIVDDLSLQKYLSATGLFKDSIQDSLDMIVSNNGKLNNAVVR